MVVQADIVGIAVDGLRYGSHDLLACLQVTVDAPPASPVGSFLAGWDACADRTGWDWSANRRTLAATVGIEIAHDCGAEEVLRLELDLDEQLGALRHLAETEVLLVWPGPVAIAVDGAMVRRALGAARSGAAAVAAAAN